MIYRNGNYCFEREIDAIGFLEYKMRDPYETDRTWYLTRHAKNRWYVSDHREPKKDVDNLYKL